MKVRGECYLLMTLAIIKWSCIFICAEEVKLTIASIDSPEVYTLMRWDRSFSTQLSGKL
jgi:hypothetical protein